MIYNPPLPLAPNLFTYLFIINNSLAASFECIIGFRWYIYTLYRTIHTGINGIREFVKYRSSELTFFLPNSCKLDLFSTVYRYERYTAGSPNILQGEAASTA